MKILHCAALAAGLFALGAHAQTPPPEMPAEMPAEQPAARTPARKPAQRPAVAPAPRPATPAAAAPPPAETPVIVNETEGAGTTLVGDRESPIGLYLVPWRGSQAEGGLDRPARLLDDALLPLDPDVFHRQVIYNQKLSEHLHQAGRITP